MHDTPQVARFAECRADRCTDAGCEARTADLGRPHLILRTDSDEFRVTAGLEHRKACDYAVVVHDPSSIVFIELKGSSYSVTEVHEQLQNVADVLRTGPSARAFPVVFASRHDSMATRNWKLHRVKWGDEQILVQTRPCGATIASLDSSLRVR